MSASRKGLILSFTAAVAMALILLMMGRVPICTCGYVKLWHGVVFSSENSQHLTDWYTPSHIIHGFAFFGLTWLLSKRVPLGWRLFIATLIEAGWEILENSPLIIDRYRSATAAFDYFGDSVINSISDLGAMWFGFWLASKMRWYWTVLLFLLFEAVTVYMIHDGLLLNILMLTYPLDAVKEWQAMAH